MNQKLQELLLQYYALSVHMLNYIDDENDAEEYGKINWQHIDTLRALNDEMEKLTA